MRVANDRQRMEAISLITTAKLPFVIEVRAGPRSLSQNALSHVWYAQIARQGREMGVDEARCFCKLRFGVPILRADSEAFRGRWDRLIKNRFTYEEKLELMIDFPVTSLMDPEQMRQYLTAMQIHFAPKGIVLEGLDKGYEASYPEARRA